jgi:hypothetical protein
MSIRLKKSTNSRKNRILVQNLSNDNIKQQTIVRHTKPFTPFLHRLERQRSKPKRNGINP